MMAEPTEIPETPEPSVPTPRGVDVLSQALDKSQGSWGPLTGHPAEETQEDQTETADTGPADSETPDETAAPPAAPEPDQESIRRAEEAQQRMREALEEAAELRKQQEALQARLDAIEARQAAPPEPTPPPEPPWSADTHFSEMRRKMRAVSPEAEDYEDQLWSIQDAAYTEFYQRIGKLQPQGLQPEEVDQRVQAALAARDQAELAERERQALLSEQQTVYQALISSARSAGLEVDEPTRENPLGGRHYTDLIAAAERGAYPADADRETAIAAVINLVKTRHSVQEAPPAAPPPATNGTVNPSRPPPAPMVRQGQGRSTEAKDPMAERQMSLNEMVDMSLQPRR